MDGPSLLLSACHNPSTLELAASWVWRPIPWACLSRASEPRLLHCCVLWRQQDDEGVIAPQAGYPNHPHSCSCLLSQDVLTSMGPFWPLTVGLTMPPALGSHVG